MQHLTDLLLSHGELHRQLATAKILYTRLQNIVLNDLEDPERWCDSERSRKQLTAQYRLACERLGHIMIRLQEHLPQHLDTPLLPDDPLIPSLQEPSEASPTPEESPAQPDTAQEPSISYEMPSILTTRDSAHTPEQDPAMSLNQEETESSDLWPYLDMTRGKRAIIIGSNKRGCVKKAVADYFGFKEVKWVETEKQKKRPSKIHSIGESMRRGGVDYVFELVDRTQHSSKDGVKKPARRLGITFLTVSGKGTFGPFKEAMLRHFEGPKLK